MALISSFIKNFKTPVFAGVLFLYCNIAFGWYDIEHYSPSYASLSAGAEYYNHDLVNSKYVSTYVDKILYSGNIYFSDPIPFLSRFEYSRAEKTEFDKFDLGKKDSYRMLFGELKTPFEITLLDHPTPFYLSYRLTEEMSQVRVKEVVDTIAGTVATGDRLSFGERLEYFTFALDAPVTGNDSVGAYSRFGIYFSNSLMLRTVYYHPVSSDYLLNIYERHGGFFYEISKPAIVKNLILKFNFAVGVGSQELKRNSYVKNSDLKNNLYILFTDIKLGVQYNIPVTDYFYFKTFANYRYKSLQELSTLADSYIKASYVQQYNAGLGAVINF